MQGAVAVGLHLGTNCWVVWENDSRAVDDQGLEESIYGENRRTQVQIFLII